MTRLQTIIAHVTFWLLSGTMSVFLWGITFYKEDALIPWLIDVISTHLSVILYFYIIYFLLVPRFWVKRKFFAFTFWLLLLIIFHIASCIFLWNNYTFDIASLDLEDYGPMTYECFFYGMVSIGFSMLESWRVSEQKRQQLEQELKATELLFLQSQMSPHFLFNTLNNIYGLSLNDSPLTSVAASQLKNLMQYFQYFEKGGRVLVEDEIKSLEAFIALHQLRNTVDVVFNKDLSGNLQHTYIEPTLLLPFVENAFKHGDLNKKIEIDLSVSKDQVHFEVRNSTNYAKRKDSVGGIGIRNIQRQLELLYPGAHHLIKKEEYGVFTLSMAIQLV